MDATEAILTEPPATDLPAFTHQQIKRTLAGVVLCIFLAAIDQTVVVPAVPAIAADLNGFGHLAWIVSAYLITCTSMTPIYGKLSDIYGRRGLLLPAIGLFMFASALCAMAQTLPQLIAARALQGIGGGGLMSMAQASIADVVAPRERGRYQAYMAGAWAVACIAGPIVGGWMTDAVSWRAIFWINLPIGALAMVLSNRALRMIKVRRLQTRIDYPGAILLTGVITAFLLVMSWGGEVYAWLSPELLATAGAAVLLVAALILQERRAPDPLLPPRLFANTVFDAGVVIAFIASAGIFGGTFLLPLYFQFERGADASQAGALIVPFLATHTIGAFGAGQLARRVGKLKAILLAGIAAATLGFALLATIGAHTPAAAALSYMAIVGVGIGACMPATLMMVQNAVGQRDVGTATAALLFLRSMGGAFGSTLVGAILVSHFASGLAAGGITRPFDLGSLRGGGATLAGIDAATRAIISGALEGSFQLAFALCAVLSAVAFLVCLASRDLPLRSAGDGRQVRP
jgi:EmrB/QacA subfamily drug resistance transporter